MKEHLELYARIKGVVDYRIDTVSAIYSGLTFDAFLHALDGFKIATILLGILIYWKLLTGDCLMCII